MSLFDDVFNPTKADLEAIYQYVRSRRPDAVGKPAALAAIVSFESWYQGLGLADAVLDAETLKEAKRRREAVNAALGDVTPADRVPVDAPQTPPPRDETLDAIRAGIPEAGGQLVSLVKLAAVAAVGVLLLNLYSGTKVR
jgi:hypothetical protein